MSGFNPAGMVARIQAAQAAAHDGAAQGLFLATEHVLGVAKARVPIEEATLERSGTAQVDDANLTGYVSFDTPYAVVQHEDLTLQHDAGRQGKYLESAFNSERETCRKLIGRAVSSQMGGS